MFLVDSTPKQKLISTDLPLMALESLQQSSRQNNPVAQLITDTQIQRINTWDQTHLFP